MTTTTSHTQNIVRAIAIWSRRINIVRATCIAVTLLAAVPAAALGPDLTNGTTRFTVDRTYTRNLGPTGLRGWIYDRPAYGYLTGNQGTMTADEPWQILVTDVGTGTPAYGILLVDDVILGVRAGASSAVPLFTNDSRKSFGWTIGDAEAGDGKFSLRIDRYGVPTNQYYTIQLGLTGLAYSTTAPYNCPKSAKVLSSAINVISNISFSSGGIADAVLGLAKMSVGITNAPVKTYAASIASPGTLNPFFDNTSGYISWDWGYKSVFLTEYFLLTGDTSVTNGIRAYAIALAHAKDMYGLMGHRGTEDHHDGTFNDRNASMGYGPMNSASLPGSIGLVLSKKCGIAHADIDGAIARGNVWFSYFGGKGTIGYGEHEPGPDGHSSNGKDAMAAVYFALQGDKPVQAEYFERMCVGEHNARELGHTGQGFSYLWLALAANMGGPTAMWSHIAPVRWHLDLSRRSNGSFIYDGKEQYGGSLQPSYWGSAEYGGMDPTAWYVLLYGTPAKKIYITGKNPSPTNTLSTAVVSNAVWAGNYSLICSGYTTNELLSHFGEYDPVVRWWAADTLAKTPGSNTLVDTLITLTTNDNPRVRSTACQALGTIKITSALPALMSASYDTDAWVRDRANAALENFGTLVSGNPYITNLLTSVALHGSTNQYEIPEDDPLRFGNEHLAQLLFNTLGSTTVNQPTNLLYPAFAAIAAAPGGHARGSISTFMSTRLSWAHVQGMAPSLVQCAMELAPADRMFAKGPLLSAIQTLARYKVEEGIPLAVRYLDKYIYGIHGGVEQEVMTVLSNTYRGSAREALPALNQYKPYVSGDTLLSLTNTINAIQNLSGPALTNFKAISYVDATPMAMTPPTTNAALRSFVTDIDLGVPFYAWSKASGAGTVTFAPNNSTAGSNVTASFSGPGTYVIQMACVDKSILDTSTWKWSSAEPDWRDFSTYTNIIGAVYTNLTVTVYDRPFVNITNSDFSVSMYVSATRIGGTNNAAVVGGMRLTSVTGAATNYAANVLAASPWSAMVSNLIDSATNVVTITGTNAMGVATGDTVRIYRPAFAFLEITNSGAVVTLPASSNTWRVAGTNNALIVGGMAWTNAAIGGGNGMLNPAPGNWSFNVALSPGFNPVTVYGTNILGDLVPDSVTIIVGEPPMVAISNVPTSVMLQLPSTAANQYLAGTNTSVIVGGMRWTNALGGANGIVTRVGGTQWNCSPTLAYGTNILVVSGTNVGGYVAADTISVYRATLPFIDIINTSFTTSMYTDAVQIGGTNTIKAVGGMRLVSVTGITTNYSTAFPATLSWTAGVTNLVGGATNFVTATVSNDMGETATDTIEIYRKPMAIVDITNLTGTVQVPLTTTNQLVAGTNNEFIVGTMWWTNTLGGSGTMGVGSTGWTFDTSISWFYPGLNVITVYGTNDIGDVSSDTVTIAVPSPRQFFWTNTAGGVWSAAGNWTNELGVSTAPNAGGASYYSLTFACGGTYGPSNDFPDGFKLNKLNYGTGNPQLSGSTLTFTNDGANLPQVNHNGSVNLTVSNQFFFATNVTFAGTSGSRLYLYGALSGPGGIIKNANHQLMIEPNNRFLPNSYAGGTVFNSGTLNVNGRGLNWFVSFGTGPVTVNGGSFAPGQQGVSNANVLTFNGGLFDNGNSFGTAWYGPVIVNTNLPIRVRGGIGFYGPISGPGGFVFTRIYGARPAFGLYGTNTYIGGTTIKEGCRIECSNTFSLPPGRLTIDAGDAATLITNGAAVLYYTGTRVIDSLYLAGVKQDDGEYGAAASPAPNPSLFFVYTNMIVNPTNAAITNVTAASGVGTVTVMGPYVDITNLSGMVFLSTNVQEVAGINGQSSVGLWWENSLGGGGTLDPAPGVWSFNADVYDGNNIIAVYSTNAMGDMRADTVSLYRAIAPFVDITNGNFSVAMEETYTYIAGTNNAGPLGNMTLTSVAGGATNYSASTAVATPWMIYVGNLIDNATNYVTMRVTNNLGEQATDTIEIYRPQYLAVSITNLADDFTTTNTSVYVAGTNSMNIAGVPWWTNSLGGGGTLAYGDWNFTADLALGTNVITVSGSNLLDAVASDTITVVRRPVGTDKLMLTFGPGAVITGTNIQWDLKYGADVSALAPTYTISDYAWATPPSGSTQDFTTPQEYVVTAEDLSSNVYLVTVTILPTATNYFWTNVVGGVWSDDGSWTNAEELLFGPVSGGASFYRLNFNAAGTFVANNDLASGFALNQLNLGGSGVTLTGNRLALTNDGAQLPQVNHNVAANLSVSNNLVLATNVTFGGTSGNNLYLYGVLSGPGGIVKNTAGTLYFYPNAAAQPNTYSGGTVLNSGTLSVSGEALNWFAGLGTGPVTINAGSFAPQRTGTANVNRVTFNGGSWANGNSFGTAWYGPINLNTNVILKPNGEIELYGDVSGPGTLTVAGQYVGNANRVVLRGTNTYTGGTTVSNGVLEIRTPLALAPSELNIYNVTATYARLNYAGTRIIDVLILDGVKQEDGIYGSTNSTATFQSTFFASTGTVTVLGPLVIDVTNLPSGVVTVTDTTQYIAGTNNFRIVGGMTWTNCLTGSSGVLDPAPQDWSFTTDLNPGYNTIIVSGTNVVGRACAETVVVSRATAPYADITNGTAMTVGMYVNLATIGGTNNAGSVGGMSLASVAGGVTNYSVSIPVAPDWTATVSNLVAGMTNVVTITVTNALAGSATDTIAIYRRPIAIVDITNIVGMIYTTNTVETIAGTNNAFIVGGMVWTNSLGGNGVLNPVPGNWNFSITVHPSNNVVTVYGTNAAGELATDTVIVGPPSPSNEIISCSFGPWGNATIVGTNITISILPVAPLSNLAPTFVISDYATMNPPSGTTNDFTSPKFYTVTSQSGLAKQYKVTVTTWPYSGSLYVLTTPNGANLPGSALETNFPLLVRLNPNNFTFSQAQANGADIRFCLQNGTKLPYQIEEWDTNVGAAVWVLMPFIKGNTNQEFRMCWGLAGVTNESSGTAVFNTSNGYACVMHLNKNVLDATGASTPANNGAVPTTAVIGSSTYKFTSTSVSCTNVMTLPTGTNPPSTSVIWLRVRDFETWSMPLAWGNKKSYGWNTWEMQLGFWGTPSLILPSPMVCRGPAAVTSSTYLEKDRWYHVQYTTSNGTGRVYIDGQLDGTASGGTITLTNPQSFYLGGIGDYDIDEMRISSLIRNADWIKMEYENQKILQTMVGPIVQPGTNFSVSPASVTMNENTTTNFTAQAGGAIKLYWVKRLGGVDTLLAVDQTTFAYSPGRVTGAQALSIQLRAVYTSGIVLTSDIPVTVNDTIPDPAFTLIPSTNLWDGRSVMTVKTNLSNWAALLASGYTNLTYAWTVDGVAVTKVITPGMMTLTFAQGSGPMTVTLVLDNGGALVTNFVTIQVQEPTNEAWIVRTPDANEKPVNNQFYARDDAGYGALYYNGNEPGGSPTAFLKVYTNGVLYTNIVQTLAGGNYAFTAKIPAGLIQHTVEYGTGAVVLATVTNIVCGDAYLVDGQSNAVSSPEDGAEPNPYTNLWIRSYGKTLGWGYGTRDGNIDEHKIGHWQMDIASNIVAVYKMPVCIINVAVGGTRIDVHMPGSTIFNNLTNRVMNARLTHGIRGAFWHQGENNSGIDGPDPGYDYEYYKQYFVDMTAAWKGVMPNLRYYYLFQVWPAPCGMDPCGDQLRDVQRNLPRLFSPRMKIMSTLGNQPGIGCHTPRAGYLYLANLTMPLVYQDNYGYAPGTTNTAPNLRIARFNGTSQVVLEFDQNVVWNPLATDMFYLDNVGGKVASGTAAGNAITLNLTGPSSAQAITYVDDQQNWSGTVTNHILWGNNGVAALTFADVPIGSTTNGPSDVKYLVLGRGADYGQMQLSWSNGLITVLACTNRSYTTNMSYWFVLASGVSTPWTHTAASNFPSVYYRIVGGSYTSEYAVGKYDVDIAPGSIAWLSFPFAVQSGCDIVAEWFGQQLEVRPYTSYDFPVLQRQTTPGGTIENNDYYFDDFGGTGTNWFPTNTVMANAGYVLFLPQNHGGVKVTGIGMVQTNNVTMQMPYNSIPWVGLAYDVVMDMRQSGLTNMLQPPRLYSTFNYDFVDSQQTPGGPIWYAEYYRDNWGGNAVNFFPSETGADMLEPGKGYLLFFSTSRAGTGTWTCVKPY